MEDHRRDRRSRRRDAFGNRAISSSLRSRRLSLPAIHNRDTTALLELLDREDLREDDLRQFVESRNAQTVFALIQSAARRLGEAWRDDEIGFADMTVTMSRLHQLLSMTGDPEVSLVHGPAFAVLVQPFDDHILGGALLEARLRHAGFATEFFPSWSGEPLAEFDGVFICVSNHERRKELERQISAIRRANGRGLPIIIGGRGSNAAPEPRGADLVTSSLLDAVDFCESFAPGTDE